MAKRVPKAEQLSPRPRRGKKPAEVPASTESGTAPGRVGTPPPEGDQVGADGRVDLPPGLRQRLEAALAEERFLHDLFRRGGSSKTTTMAVSPELQRDLDFLSRVFTNASGQIRPVSRSALVRLAVRFLCYELKPHVLKNHPELPFSFGNGRAPTPTGDREGGNVG